MRRAPEEAPAQPPEDGDGTSRRGEAAVRGDHRSCHEAGPRRGEEAQHFGDLPRLRHPPQGVGVGEGREVGAAVGAEGVEEVGLDDARGDEVVGRGEDVGERRVAAGEVVGVRDGGRELAS